MNSVKYRVAVGFALLGTFVLLFGSSAQAAVLSSVETTRSFLGRGDAPVVLPAGMDRLAVINALKANYGTGKPQMDALSFVIDSKGYKLTASERGTLTPKAVDFELLADAVMVNGLAAGAVVDTNALAAKMVPTSAINAVVKAYAKKLDKPAVDMTYIYDKKAKKLGFKAAQTGLKLEVAAGRAALQAALRQLAAAGWRATLTTTDVPLTTVVAKRTQRSQLAKAIVVDLSQRRVSVYNKGKKTKVTYRCAIGMKGFGTPPGQYWVGLKRPRPTWSNPGSAWAAGMPSSIGPGASNPLGLRALNLNNAKGGDTGYRIHGTSKLSSIGTAASHGCIRLANANIVKLYKQIPTGTPVIVQP